MDFTVTSRKNLSVPGRLQKIISQHTRNGVCFELKAGMGVFVPAGVMHAAVNTERCVSLNISACTNYQDVLSATVAMLKWNKAKNTDVGVHCVGKGYAALVDAAIANHSSMDKPAWRVCLAELYKQQCMPGCTEKWLAVQLAKI